MNFLSEVCGSTWSELERQQTGSSRRRQKHHSQEVSTLCKAARDRLADLRHDEIFGDDLFRFRLGGTARLWGFVVDDVFYLLWWDRHHRVYPTD